LRVGLVIYGSLEIVSGGYLYDRILVEYLRAQGDQVEIISLPWRTYPRHIADNFSSELLERIAGLDVDVLLQDELNHPSLFLLNRRLRPLVNYPVISIIHHLRSSEDRPAAMNWLYRQIEKSYLASVDGFIYNSETTKNVVESFIGGSKPGIVARPAGDRHNPQIDEGEIELRARQPGPLRVLFLGNVIPRKGLHILLAALAQLPPESWRLTVVGGLHIAKAYVSEIKRMIAQNDLADWVHFIGPLSDKTLADQLRSHHLVALPSSYEGFGIAYLEGMGFGLPAIATTGGAAQEIITPGENGFLIEPRDSAALAGLLAELSKNRELLLNLSIAARKRYLRHPTWRQTAESIRKFLRDFPVPKTAQSV
jgi:glycosyltransferase involved in cell wall biosynthesis